MPLRFKSNGIYPSLEVNGERINLKRCDSEHEAKEAINKKCREIGIKDKFRFEELYGNKYDASIENQIQKTVTFCQKYFFSK
jgi:hypothetical protein